MIFKTFDSNIDKWTSKIGIFEKSFNELGTAVNNAFKSAIDNFDENVGFWKSLKNNLFSKKDKDWIKNSLGEIISKENIDRYIVELDLDSAKEKLIDIFDWEGLVNQNKKTWQDYFDTLDDDEKYIVDLIKNTNDLSKLTGEDLVDANQQARIAIIAHNEAIKNSTLAAKAGKIALQGLAIAGNMLATWAILKGIQLATSAIDHFVNRVKYAQEAMKEAQKAIDESQNKLKSANEVISENKKRFLELRQGDICFLLTKKHCISHIKYRYSL